VFLGGGSITAATISTGHSTAATAAAQTAAASHGDDVLSVARVRAEVKAGLRPRIKSTPGAGLTRPPSPSECRARIGVPCYGAPQLRRAYGLDQLTASGVDGRNSTAALIMPYHNPVFTHDVQVYAATFGLPRPDVTVIQHGPVPTADSAKPDQAIAEQEALLDAQMILTAAPRTHLIYLETSPALFDGPDGFRGVADELAWLTSTPAGAHVGAVSYSYGWFEQHYVDYLGSTQAARAMLTQQSQLIQRVVQHRHVTVLTADGDTGPTGPKLDGTGLYPDPTAAFLASSPAVTGVSATELHLTDQGTRTAPDTVWGEHNGDQYATGGAPSAFFPRPHYQDTVQNVVGAHRGVGDIAMIGSLGSEVLMYTSRYQALPGQSPGWVHTAGTSASSPLFTGIVADAIQIAHHRLGNINPALYQLGRTPTSRTIAGIQDVTSGCNKVTGVQWSSCATAGYDLASGVGTVEDASRFVPALAAAVRR
jgi:subtilase family serine protease